MSDFEQATVSHVMTLPQLVLEESPLVPGMDVTILVTPDVADVIQAAKNSEVFASLRDARIGVVAQFGPTQRIPDGRLVVQLIPRVRAEVIERTQRDRVVYVSVMLRPDPQQPTEEEEELRRELLAALELWLPQFAPIGVALIERARAIRSPGALADLVGRAPQMPVETRERLLNALDVKERLHIAIDFVKEQISISRAREKIEEEIKSAAAKAQREYFLREQLKAIKKELGEDLGDPVEHYRQLVEQADLPDHVREQAEKELTRLAEIPPGSPETSIITTYLDWLVSMPWKKSTEDQLDLDNARRILDEDHYGLEEVKERIIEYLAIRKLKALKGEDSPTQGQILALVGPPGVGKTSLGQSIARALGRKFVRMSLGGLHDEAEIRGHRRTYIGAMPGRIAQGLRRAGSNNPVFMLDEIDKVGNDWRGDPSSALLEILDPAQNSHFHDNYLDVDLDLSKVLFIATANVLETIQPALRDRLEIIRIDGYTTSEKVKIAENHLIKRQLRENVLADGELVLPPETIEKIVLDYTREAGVRELERQIGKIARKVAAQKASNPNGFSPVVVTPDDLSTYLGKPTNRKDLIERLPVPGTCTGLAVTAIGGDVLTIEAVRVPGSGQLILTGQLGEVMQESAKIALTLARSVVQKLGINENPLNGYDIHVHFPEGAIPKDGPSAGVAITTALVSLLTGKVVIPKLAMTGEVTLQGRVLAVGGIKQKLMAAHRYGYDKVIIPAANEIDLDDLPQEILNELQIIKVSNIDEVLSIALELEPGLAKVAE
jgi:ATP-dependent Lon protease